MLAVRSVIGVRALSSAAEAATASSSSTTRIKGRYQTWRKPVYQSPHIHPLENGPDFSFQDGRTVHVTSKVQLEHKLDQIRLGKRMVSLLNDIRLMEETHKQAKEERESEKEKEDSRRPIAKGTQSIV